MRSFSENDTIKPEKLCETRECYEYGEKNTTGEKGMYKKSSTGWLKHLDFMVLDIICLQLAFVMGYFLRHHSFNPYGSPIYRNEAIVFALIQLMIMFLTILSKTS